jgi:hypothetical protein
MDALMSFLHATIMSPYAKMDGTIRTSLPPYAYMDGPRPILNATAMPPIRQN